MTEANEMMFNKSKNFLQTRKKYLSKLVNTLNYDTCHAIEEYDAAKCAEDCENLGKRKVCQELHKRWRIV